ncbi:MAG: VOC family protein [Deltaproteobacteria bacterium]|nr:VOC family protein [Deltaproteobacteria bacterium]
MPPTKLHRPSGSKRRKPQPTGVHHLAVLVHDLAAAERFYVRVLGLRVIKRWTDGAGEPRSVWLATGGDVFVAIERAARSGPTRHPQAPGWHCLALAIPPKERDRWRARLRRAKVEVARESAYTLYINDPEGNLIGLSHYPVAAA